MQVNKGSNVNNTAIYAGMATHTTLPPTHSYTEFSPQQIKQLSETLFPLFLDSMEKHIEDVIMSPLKKKRDEEEKNMSKLIKQLQSNVAKNENALKGYKQQITLWTKKVENLQKHVNQTDAEKAKEAKQIKVSCKKLEEYTATHTKMKNNMQNLQKMKVELTKNVIKQSDIDKKIENIKKHFDDTIKTLQESSKPANGESIQSVENSQEFINNKFEELKQEVTKEKETIKKHLNEHDGQLRVIANYVDKTQDKTANNAQYLRRDCAVIKGVPEEGEEDDSNHNEKCKKKVLAIFKELNLIVAPEKISILHRLKESKHSKPGQPRGIIVKFTSREVCHDVLQLQKVCKTKTSWRFDRQAKRIFINEALTPEKRKLLYDTKTSVNQHLYDKHGIIYVWTYHGNVYIRKNAEGAPKIMIKSNWDLYNVIKGFTSLDVKPKYTRLPHEIEDKTPWWCNMKDFPPISRY